MPPRVIVQIITYRTEGIEAELDVLFESLAKVRAPEGGWVLAIIDQPSSLGNLREYLETKVQPRSGVDLPEVVLMFNDENAGFAGGHMKLFAAIHDRRPEFVYLLNQDAYVDPNFLISIVQHAESDPNAAIIQSRIMRAQTTDQYNSAGNAMHFLGFGFSLANGNVRNGQSSVDIERAGLPMFYASGAGMLIRSSTIDHVGGMFAPVYFMYHEDVDIAWRARLAGFDIGFADDSVVYHRYEFSRSMKKFYWMERNRHLTNLCNYQFGTLLLIAPAMMVMELGTLFFSFQSGWWREKIRSWMFFVKISTWQYIFQRRRFVHSIRARSDRGMLQDMVGIVTAQETKSILMTYLVNPLLSVYFRVLKYIMLW